MNFNPALCKNMSSPICSEQIQKGLSCCPNDFEMDTWRASKCLFPDLQSFCAATCAVRRGRLKNHKWFPLTQDAWTSLKDPSRFTTDELARVLRNDETLHEGWRTKALSSEGYLTSSTVWVAAELERDYLLFRFEQFSFHGASAQ